MGERLTDEELARLLLIADTHTGGITMGRSNARSVLLEIRERRAQDLSAADIENLKCLYWWSRNDVDGDETDPDWAPIVRGLAVLDKLLTRPETP